MPRPLKFVPGEIVGGIVIGSARERWREIVRQAHAHIGFICVPPRSDPKRDLILLQEGIAEISRIRIAYALAPIFSTLRRIEIDLAVIAALYPKR